MSDSFLEGSTTGLGITLDGGSHSFASPRTQPDNRSILRRTVDFLRPEVFLRRLPGRVREGETGWLDGLRGVAALVVCIVHLTIYTHPSADACLGQTVIDFTRPDGLYIQRSPIALPIVRLLFVGGHFAVMLFFVISGYALTRSPLTYLHAGKTEAFAASIQSGFLRRAIRLFVPVYLSTLALVFVWHVTGVATPWPEHQPTLLAELRHWAREMVQFSNPLRKGDELYTMYNIHTWTLPVELRGSLLCFGWLLSAQTFPPRRRALATIALIPYFLYAGRGAFYACFLFGLLVGECDLVYSRHPPSHHQGQIPQGDRMPWDGIRRYLAANEDIRGLFWHGVLVMGLVLGGTPSHGINPDEAMVPCGFPWTVLSLAIGKEYLSEPFGGHYKWFWLFPGASLTFLGCRNIKWIRSILTRRTAQYLARHSFALYLTHGPVIGIVSERLFYATEVKLPAPDQYDTFAGWVGIMRTLPVPILNRIPDLAGGPYGLEPRFLFCVAISLPVMLYVAELATKAIDAPSIRLARWCERALVGDQDDGGQSS
ncbi:hypothetical protein PYCC9005_003374 [Savitreella phatthalungensis]